MSLEIFRFNPSPGLETWGPTIALSYLASREQLLLGLAVLVTSHHPLSPHHTKIREAGALWRHFLPIRHFPQAVSLFSSCLTQTAEKSQLSPLNLKAVLYTGQQTVAQSWSAAYIHKWDFILEYSPAYLFTDSPCLFLHWSCSAGTEPKWPLSLVRGLSNFTEKVNHSPSEINSHISVR